MDKIDQEILRIIQNGIPLIAEPFREVAEKTGIDEDEVIARLNKLRKTGIIRRFGASINHRKIGMTANAMVTWTVPKNLVEKVGEIMSSYKAVTHCYERQTIPKKWEHNLFTIIHGYNRKSVEQNIKKLSKITGIKDYLVLFSTKEFKRTSAGRII